MVLTTIITVAFVGIAWASMCLVLRATNFNSRGRKRDRHTADGADRVNVIRYHNEAIYRAFEFYFKVALAVLGGMAFIVLQTEGTRHASVDPLLVAVTWILWSAAVVFSAVIFMHQKSKIERWKERYSWWEPLLWIEFPLISIMYVIASGVQFQLLPRLLR